jgi:hypothetical protein
MPIPQNTDIHDTILVVQSEKPANHQGRAGCLSHKDIHDTILVVQSEKPANHQGRAGCLSHKIQIFMIQFLWCGHLARIRCTSLKLNGL